MNLVTMIFKCSWCPDRFKLSLPEKGYRKWQGGELVQRAFPDLDELSREQLITSGCTKCLDYLYGSYEDDE